MGTYYKQIGVYKTRKALLEFLDDTRYDSEILAWPHMRSSRIRIGMKDYSKGIGENAVDVFYNLSPEEFIRLVESLNEIRQVSDLEKKRWDLSIARLNQVLELYNKTQMPAEQITAVRDLIAEFSNSRNEVFAEAGAKLSEAFERLVSDFSAPLEKGLAQTSKILTDAQKERDNATKVREVYGDIKILNYDKYANPDNPAERRITTFRVAYAANMGFPFIIEIGNGWGEPFISKNGGTTVKEGSTRIVDKVQIFIQDKHLFPLLRRVQLFLETMTAQAIGRYYDKVSEPMLLTYDTEE